MTVLIKSSEASRRNTVRGLSAAAAERQPVEPWIDPEIIALRAEVARLREDLAERQARIERHPSELEDAYARGEAAGREAGFEEADDAREALTTRLVSAVDEALGAFAEELLSVERLAGLLAVEGLEKILGRSEDRADLVLGVIRNQAAGLKAQTVFRVEVSSEDFPDGGRLIEVEAALGRDGVEVRASADLASGDCRMKLQLGEIEVGVDQQWGQLRALLSDLAEPGPSR